MARKPGSDSFPRGEKELLGLEEATTRPGAQLSAWAARRLGMESEGRQYELRTPFQHDRDRIVHSRAFRRLKHKTQVFIPYRNDHLRTRLTHTVEVMQISRTIARSLALNEDLTEAVALGHDLGHTPFGHIGERTLDKIMRGKARVENIPLELASKAGGFKHNVQSLRVVDQLEERYEHPGLNLTDQTREGILKHTGWQRWTGYPDIVSEGVNLDRKLPHFEGQSVAVADEIAQQTHDLEDGLRSGLITLADIEKLEITRRLLRVNIALREKGLPTFARQNIVIRGLIHILVADVITTSAAKLDRWRRRHGVSDHESFRRKQDAIGLCIGFSKEAKPLFAELKRFVLDRVIGSKTVRLNDESGEYFIRELFKIYYADPLLLPEYLLGRYAAIGKIDHLRRLSRRLPDEEIGQEVEKNYQGRPQFLRLLCDYVAGMSNTYALREYERRIMPFHG